MRRVIAGIVVALCVLTNVSLCADGHSYAADKAAAPLAIDFTLQDIDQVKFYTLSSYRQKQPVLLFFWTTWCPFCQKALKSLSMMHDELKRYDLEVLAVNVGESPAKVKHVVDYYKIAFPVLLDGSSSAANNYDLLGVPTYILIDKEGRIIFRDNYLPKGKIRELLKDA